MLEAIKLKNIATQIPILADVTHIEPIKGGLTNINYRVDTPLSIFMLRMSSETNLLGINRADEIENLKKAYQAGIAPEVKYFSDKDNILITNWIEGKTLSLADIETETGLLERIAKTVKKLHSSPLFEGNFSYPNIRKQYLKTILDNNYFLPEGYLDVEPMLLELEKKLSLEPEKWVSCHHDLVAANFIDDGQKLWIIDYEYAGPNEPCFDIGNFAMEKGLNDAQLTTFCEAYWGEHLPEKIARAKACGILSGCVWVLWDCIQDAISPIDFDFRGWAEKRWLDILPMLQKEDPSV